jgi:fructosamine-3-kinase
MSRSTVGGRPVVVKETDYQAHLEADGLRALREAGAPVPDVIEVSATRLVIAEVGGPPDWEGLGRALARCHGATADAYGYSADNVIGPLPQVNTWTTDWADFYGHHRLGPHLEALPSDLRHRLGAAIEDGRLAGLLEHGQPPSLIHGDLWSGNIVSGRWLIDPAVCFADREMDRAFADLFGGIPPSMWDAYEQVWPLDPGWELRKPALQLYHLLIHVSLFGGGYGSMVAQRLDRLGW